MSRVAHKKISHASDSYEILRAHMVHTFAQLADAVPKKDTTHATDMHVVRRVLDALGVLDRDDPASQPMRA